LSCPLLLPVSWTHPNWPSHGGLPLNAIKQYPFLKGKHNARGVSGTHNSLVVSTRSPRTKTRSWYLLARILRPPRKTKVFPSQFPHAPAPTGHSADGNTHFVAFATLLCDGTCPPQAMGTSCVPWCPQSKVESIHKHMHYHCGYGTWET